MALVEEVEYVVIVKLEEHYDFFLVLIMTREYFYSSQQNYKFLSYAAMILDNYWWMGHLPNSSPAKLAGGGKSHLPTEILTCIGRLAGASVAAWLLRQVVLLA